MSATEPSEPSTAELQANVREARADVVADVEALKSELDPQSLKKRALEAAERSLAAVALRTLSRLKTVPSALALSARKHPLRATAVGMGLVLLAWKLSASRDS